MALNGQRIRYDAIRSLAFGSVTTNYVAVGAAFTHSARIIKITNTGDADVFISFDGTTNNDIVPAGSGAVMDYASNRVGPIDQLEQSVGTTVYVKRVSGALSSGAVYVTIVYAANN